MIFLKLGREYQHMINDSPTIKISAYEYFDSAHYEY